MGPVKCLLLAAVWIQVSSIPLSSKLSEEEEKVTKCIMEVLAESLSTQGSGRVSSNCVRILKEDERLISVLRHQHLLRELEDLTHREKSQQHEGHESSEEEELRKRGSETPIPAPKRETETKRRSDSEESNEFEKVEKVEVKEKEHGTLAEEKAHEMLEEEEDKRSAPMKRSEDQEKRSGKEVRGDVATKRKDKKHFSDENEEDSSEEGEHDRGYHGNSKGWYNRNHEGWEEKKRGSQRRMAEDPSQEETAQFESEDKGMKYFNTKDHMQGYYGEEKRHIHHPEEVDRKRDYYGPEEEEIERERHHHNGRPVSHGHREEEEERELEEMEEREEHRAQERDIHEVEEELRKAAERLQEIHRG
ncbi:coiled-coil domain-containing glutamate-rich protein 2 [Mixophyes fleayi]|uniref:coiled-coil domain-containing glutamate-rich protein 2 n=1 Tax=Mixophyes fleayi TaxID=3061075 RepID=UPI003F4DC770